MFNTEKESYFNAMDKYGIQISAMGDIMVDEIMMMRLQEMVGLDYEDGGSADVDKVLSNAKSNGFRNLGGFGGSSVSQEDNYVFHMDCEEVQKMAKESKLVRKAMEVADSYMELGYYIEDKTYSLRVEVSMVDFVKIKAKSEQEAIDAFLNDVINYSELGSLVDNVCYNGISSVKVQSTKENFLK